MHQRLLWAGIVGLCVACSATPESVGDDHETGVEAREDGSGGSDADGAPDADADGDADAEGLGEDGGEAEADGPACDGGLFGSTCRTHTDCCPGLVCFAPEGDSRPAICTEYCDEECPEGYACRLFSDGTGGEAWICWYPEDTLCNACEENAECGDVLDLCIEMPPDSDEFYCSIDCDPDDPYGCPAGFHCMLIETEITAHQCMPDDGVCCIDGDGDEYGRGDACPGDDCDDRNAAVNPGAEEVCDGIDNDCDGGIDNDLYACGACSRCAGGTCVDVAEGDDPREECPAVDCDPYYWGWDPATRTCYRLADVPAALAGCDGAGACRAAEAECRAHNIMGTATTRCTGTADACQLLEGCEGTTDGRCVNLDDPADLLACGVGECHREVQHCIAGVEQACVPGTPAAVEACDDRDDDCDGLTDVSTVFSSIDANEPNESCADQTDLGAMTAPVTGVSVPGPLVIYPEGDGDYYQLLGQEPTDPPWECLPILCIERYRLTITLTRPPDGAAYELCASADSCGGETCTTGASRTLEWTGECGANNDRRVYFSVRGPAGSGSFDCHSYEVRITFEAWLADSGVWPGCPGA